MESMPVSFEYTLVFLFIFPRIDWHVVIHEWICITRLALSIDFYLLPDSVLSLSCIKSNVLSLLI